ncbi:DegV family protein [Conexibacter sp. CPCC 206217]|uniref:DegV family protein n=1 Tax=Conexibacter sp. CPCC 206217 TaxID=3064574 RepID=UPI002716FDDE|nr:DegV family protein [Conexibacter sp. CPCC 206217]MDO8209431.1 DegV family protein [Conexibacter sp. CPCC 206217]
MASVAIVTDTCHYLPRQLVAARGIHEVSLYVHWDGREDRESALPDFDRYYDHLSSTPSLPTTSQPSIGDFLAVYEPLLDAGRDIVSIHLAGGMSGTVGAAQQAREQLGERAPRVHVLDSESACGGEGLVVLAAHAAAVRGTSAEDVVAHARAARAELKMWFAIDTLEFLRRGGRIAAAQAWVGSALRIKPILTVDSEITPIERVRTSGRAFERLVDYLRTRKDDGAEGWVIQHIQAPDECARLVARGREIFGTDPVFVSEVGPVIGTHVGPGLLGAGAVPLSYLS